MEAQYARQWAALSRPESLANEDIHFRYFMINAIDTEPLGGRLEIRSQGYPTDMLDNFRLLQPSDQFAANSGVSTVLQSHMTLLGQQIRDIRQRLDAGSITEPSVEGTQVARAREYFRSLYLQRRVLILSAASASGMPTDGDSMCAYRDACTELLKCPLCSSAPDIRSAIEGHLRSKRDDSQPPSPLEVFMSWQWARLPEEGAAVPLPVVSYGVPEEDRDNPAAVVEQVRSCCSRTSQFAVVGWPPQLACHAPFLCTWNTCCSYDLVRHEALGRCPRMVRRTTRTRVKAQLTSGGRADCRHVILPVPHCFSSQLPNMQRAEGKDGDSACNNVEQVAPMSGSRDLSDAPNPVKHAELTPLQEAGLPLSRADADASRPPGGAGLVQGAVRVAPSGAQPTSLHQFPDRPPPQRTTPAAKDAAAASSEEEETSQADTDYPHKRHASARAVQSAGNSVGGSPPPEASLAAAAAAATAAYVARSTDGAGGVQPKVVPPVSKTATSPGREKRTQTVVAENETPAGDTDPDQVAVRFHAVCMHSHCPTRPRISCLKRRL